MKDAPATTFPDHYEAVVHRVRAAVTELLQSVGADPSNSRSVARQFNLNKNLTWMLSKIVNSADVYAVAQHIPGPTRFQKLLHAMQKNGAPSGALERLQGAILEFEEMVRIHTGDRATLEVMLADLSPDDVRGEQLLQSRKLAFQGMGGVLGGQAKVKQATYVLAPDADDPASVDVLEISGLMGLRRLRTDARWLLFRREAWDADEATAVSANEEALDDAFARPDQMPLLGEFCSQPIPTLQVSRHGTETHYVLPAGPVGYTAAMTFAYGGISRRAGCAYRDEKNEHVELGCSLTTPAEAMLFDIILHERLPWTGAFEHAVYSRVEGGPAHEAIALDRNRIPITETLQRLGRGVNPLATPLMPYYSDMIAKGFERAGWDPNQFISYRFTLQYPPIPAIALVRIPLPERPGA